MYKAVTVVDDFYGDGERARSLALDRAKWLPRGDHYSYETENSFHTDDLVDRLSDLVGEPIHVDPKRMGFGVFAYYPADATVDHTTHFDSTDWSAVVYLVPDEHCEGGLTFYRHIATGLTGPPTEERARELGFASRDEFLEEVYYPDKMRPEAWEQTAHIGMRFNRAVILHGSRLFHRASSGFGDSPENGRLTQRFFFNSATTEE